MTVIVNRLLKFSAALLVANEIRGLVMAAPVMVALWHSGGTLMALWLAFCSLAGIALSVLVPLVIAKKLRQKLPVIT